MTMKTYIEVYHTQKIARVKYLNTHYSGGYEAWGNPKFGFKRRKTPWYMLTSGKCYNYEERKESFGNCVKPYRVKSEIAIINENRKKKRMVEIVSAKYMEEYAQHKLAKWETKWLIKNPKPPRDLFEKEYLESWNNQYQKEKEQALERIRDFVISIYDKLELTGRFRVSENKFVEEKIASLKDKNMEGHRINELDSKKSKLMNMAKAITNEVYSKRHNLVVVNIKDHQRKRGRLILPAA